MNIAFALLCFKPHKEWLEFITSFHYDCYVIIDDNSNNYDDLKLQYPKINFVQIEDDICLSSGYKNSHSEHFYKKKNTERRVSACEKALYYFKDKSYNHVWFCEDDVFIPSLNNLISVDNQYPDVDMLSNHLTQNDGTKLDWHWSTIDMKTPAPWWSCMVCITRLSDKLLQVIDEYVTKWGTLYFSEAMFCTEASHNGLLVKTPEQFKWVTYNNKWSEFNIQRDGFYHPVKSIESHNYLRQQI